MHTRLALFIMLFALLGCATSGGKIFDRLNEGMDKDEVLDSAGNPKRTFRSNGQDHWIYVYFERDQEMSRQISFEAGKLVRVGRPVKKVNWDKELEKLQRPHDHGFKTIDGGPEDVNEP